MDIRCDGNKLHAQIVDGFLEVRCRSQFCGYKSGVIIIHRFDLVSGKLVKTDPYSEPRKEA